MSNKDKTSAAALVFLLGNIDIFTVIPKLPQDARFSENLLGSRQGAHL
jgi:hypothetical protein